MKIGHTGYNVSDMEKAMEFYCKVLGFTHAFSIPREDGTPWIEYLKLGNEQFIELFYCDKPIDRGNAYLHLCLEVDDIHAMADQIVKAGGPLDVAPRMASDFNWQCWTHDPDGNKIEIMTISKDSPQYKAYHAE